MAKQRRNLLAKSINQPAEEQLNPKPELAKKVELKKTKLIEEEEIEKATKKIHSKKKSEKSIRFTMDIPEDVYYEIKMEMIKKRQKSMKDYFLRLSEADRG